MSSLLTTAAMCEWIGIAPATAASWRVYGRGPKHVKVGARVFYDSRDVEEWIESNKRTSTSAASSQLAPVA
jgi:predicted DNA-binding transcriptional regulator AlpA